MEVKLFLTNTRLPPRGSIGQLHLQLVAVKGREGGGDDGGLLGLTHYQVSNTFSKATLQ